MKEKRTEIILSIILFILLIIALVMAIINPQKTKNTSSIEKQQNIEKEEVANNSNKNTETNKLEEKTKSMQSGNTFCKIEGTIIYYQDSDKGIYIQKENDNQFTKLATIENGLEKMYFDGTSIYYMPNYYKDKGIYKVDLQGNTQKISENSSLQLYITDDKIYFVKQIGYDDYNKNPQGTLCVMDKDGSNLIELAQNIKNDFFISNGKIYYTTQTREMYQIDLDGTNKINLAKGRKFVIGASEKYIIYVDYAEQEAKHLLNLETKEDNIIGYAGKTYNFKGKYYLNISKRLDDGTIEKELTLFEIDENGKIIEYGKIIPSTSNLNYILNQKVYIADQQNNTSVISLQDGKSLEENNYKNCNYYLGGYGYLINTAENKIEKCNLE